MYNKIQLTVEAVSVAINSATAFAVLLKEVHGERRLPIVIGPFEAQAINHELEGKHPPRPMTHDLLRDVFEKLGATVEEIYIHTMHENTFMANIIVGSGIEIDSRPSDAIALAIRCGAPIFVNEEILEEVSGTFKVSVSSFDPDNNPIESLNSDDDNIENDFKNLGINDEIVTDNSTSVEKKILTLQRLMDKAIQQEDYERAAILRDEINRLDKDML